jgi:hypothetical protein
MKKAALAGVALALATMIVTPAARGADIVETAVAAGQFNTLAKALQAAGLVDALKAPGPVHGLRAYRRGLQPPAGRHARGPAQAGKPRQAS